MSANLTDITAPVHAMHNNSSTTADSPAVAATPSSPFRFVLYSTCFDNNPTPGEEASFEAFVGRVVEDGHRRGPRKDGAAFSPVSYRSGTTRALANVDLVYAVGLDVEHVTPARVVQLFESIAGLEFLGYTTHSHTAEDPRWRIVIALTRPVPARLYPRLWERVVEMVGADAVDPSTKDASRLFYLPAAKDGAPAELKYNSGAGVITLDPVTALELTEEQFAAAVTQNTALSLVPPAPPVSTVGGLVEKTGSLALKPRPTAAELMDRVMACQPNQWRANIEALFADQPFATAGGRDAAAHGIASTIAFVAPEADVDDLAQIFEKSVAAMWAANTSTSNPPPTMEAVKEKIRRALNEARSRAAADEEFRQSLGFAAAIDAARTGPFSMPVGAGLENPAAPEPDPKVFHGLAGRLVLAIEPHTEASPVAILAQLIVALGCVFGRGPYVLVEATHHYCNEFVVVVGRSARARKGTSWAWVQRLLKMIVPQFVAENIEHSPGSGEGIVYRVRDEVREFDKKQGVEVVVDPGVPDKRLILQIGEFAMLLQAMLREGNILSSLLRMVWDGEDLGTLTKTSRCKATGALISILAHITSVEFQRLLTTTEVANGFANRFLFVYAERTKLLPEGGMFTQGDLDPFAEEFKKVVYFAQATGEMHRDAGAKARWRTIYPELTRDEDGLVGALTCRAEAHVLRLSMIYALLDLSPVIREEHLEAAMAFWRYTDASCRIVFGDHLGDPLADALLGAMRQRPEGLTRTDISRVILGGHKKTMEITRGLTVLQKRGLAVVEQVETGGRPCETWRAVTGVGVGVKGGTR